MAEGHMDDAVTLYEEAEKACIDILGQNDETFGEIHHALAYCHHRMGERTLTKVRFLHLFCSHLCAAYHDRGNRKF